MQDSQVKEELSNFCCQKVGGRRLTVKEVREHRCLHLQRKNKNKFTRQRATFRCKMLLTVPLLGGRMGE
jgi:hypothetical protein